MMESNEKQEIIIVKRGGHGDHGHHGGAWKIAFADFMTAMMALFLVLWLINAANEESKKSVASYFNPVKLVDRNRSEKGLEESGGPTEINLGDGAAACSCETEGGEKSEQRGLDENKGGPIEEEAFFADPAETLEEIVTAHALMQEESLFNTELEQPAPTEVFDKPDEPKFVDPFSPDYWAAQEVQNAPDTAAENVTGDESSAQMTENVATSVAAEEQLMPENKPAEKMANAEEPMEIDAGTTASYEENMDDVQQSEEMSPAEMMATAQEMQSVEVASEEASPEEELAAQLDEELIQILDEIGLNADQITLVATEESVSISLADNLDFSMFGIGSAVPSAELVNAVSVIGKSLVGKPVEVSIIGHTDGRPYSGGQYDNWRLSSARAQATLYMLERGGLSKDDISSISGVADRQLRNPEDSFAPENRRIEILVEFEQS